MKKIIIMAIFFALSGCASLKEVPENLNDFSLKTRLAYNDYKQMESHKAFAVAKTFSQDFYGVSWGYGSKDVAESKAMEQCYKQLIEKDLAEEEVCFLYKSK